MSGRLLLTGATGFVGMEVLARYLERTDRDVVALVRAADDGRGRRAHRRRARGPLRPARPALRRPGQAVPADLTAPGLGLGPRRRTRWPRP